MAHYSKAPILEAIIEIRWPNEVSFDDLVAASKDGTFSGFGEPKIRKDVVSTFDPQSTVATHTSKDVGLEFTRRDGQEVVFFDVGSCAYIQKAPYDKWDNFCGSALKVFQPIIDSRQVTHLDRIGVRFVNRIDIPVDDTRRIATETFIKVNFDGPRNDGTDLIEFQMRIVKESPRQGIAYALLIATTTSPVENHGAIIVDVDAFTLGPTSTDSGIYLEVLRELREEKNEIFKSCLTDAAIGLFGEVIE